MADEVFVLGGGVTGLAAGMASGLPVLEAEDAPGGICRSYYMRPGDPTRLPGQPADDEAYRFELGGGHWIFGGDPVVQQLIRRLVPVVTYGRRASVYFRDLDRYVPYPLQGHLHALDPRTASKAVAEMAAPAGPAQTMKEWLLGRFGPTLCDLFFHPFHDRYTAGLHERIAPQDGYKSMGHPGLAIRGASGPTPPGGYNATFVYPREGLDALASRMADRCDLQSSRRVAGIDLVRHALYLADGTDVDFDALISTLPLNRVMDLAALKVDDPPDPHTSVLVLNLGAAPGPKCPDAHWVYVPHTASGFHRVGFYSNVDRAFLPRKARPHGRRVSLYVERAYLGGERPSGAEVSAYSRAAVAELQDWGYVGEVEVVDPTWIDVAYTWAWPGSRWRADALRLLEAHGVYQVGRYARWQFQGIAESIRDGLVAGASFARA